MDKTLRKSLEELNIQFITKNIWDKKVEHLKPEYCPKSREQPPCRKVKVQRISASENHPAAGQYGLFAAQNLNPGEVVLDYLGYVTSEEDADDSQYVAQLAPGVLVNAFKMGNEARFINDFHGTKKNPNVKFQRRVDDETGEWRLGVQVLKRKIRKGEELLITYGWGYDLAAE
eukprot:CAMPEP_0184328014 /NCGR_PEP_ID=MMETSP1049-20130417/143395_1 /TAXON_ID=77928 /ORGANISM="Proteomonas sulcata, Strain CCMP704" /LENGTH=172 /DNA_ID=CAMNT_0026650299 /DNA_START=182 /DNA_END=700 /DNA_ORIENTATION=+